MDYPGNLFVIAAPSGAGKSSLVNALLELDSHLVVSLSHTTRAPRGQEQQGREYHFIDIPAFVAMRDRGEFLEWAEVHGNFYGTSRLWLEGQMQAGQDMLLEIDWQGARQIRQLLPHCWSIFILPPSRAALETRLSGRGQDNPEIIARRMADAISEMSHYGEYDYLVINDVFEEALAELGAILTASRLRTARQAARHPLLIAGLLD